MLLVDLERAKSDEDKKKKLRWEGKRWARDLREG
jgi:hypothetical protein